MMDHLRADFPILDRLINGKRLAYLDSGATTQKPIQVIEAVSDYYKTSNSNVHRGAHTLGDEATTAFEGARAKIANFIGADSSDEVVFTRGTTGGLNTIAYGWGLNRLKPGDRILLTVMEHHANVVPWQLVAKHTGAELVYLELDDNYQVDLSDLDNIIDERVKIVSVSGMSNVTGTIGPVAELVAAARRVGAIVIVDAAQSVPHLPTDVSTLGADFLVFSAHKMLGPTGVGALWGRREILNEMEPAEGGGEMIADVQLYESRWAPIPHKFEAGTPPIAQAVGFGAAIDYLEKIGMTEVRRHEIEITQYALDRLSEVPDLKVIGPADVAVRGGTVSFELGDEHPHDVATILDQEGVAVRAGHHCAKPLMRYLNVPATARASFYVYTTQQDIDQLVTGLHLARRLFGLA
ncbi:MAG: cysteine desulfurase [Acidimicrobiia bacterium]|nr:cysteine desulfurase [Acidimicrobiia bacterium]MDX2465893.1 cysteine desulfurase [Acidimicrobiia bacterium]